MRFLLDAHLPPALATMLATMGHDALHTRDLADRNLTRDGVINEISIREQRVVVTKDTDFFYSYVLQGRPWKLLLICTGNIGAADLCALFKRNLPEILVSLEKCALVELDRRAVTAVQ